MPADAVRAVLSIQSEVAYGHVGNSAAVLPLQRLGFEVWPVNTVQLGHHPGYGRFRGYRVEPERVAEILEAVLERAPLERCAGMIVGYLGEGGLAGSVLRALDTLLARSPDLVFLLDPVIGDDETGVFVRPDVPSAILERLLPRAAIVTPNRFELAYLSGMDVDNAEQAALAARRILERGPSLVVATGLPDADQPDRLAMVAVSQDQGWLIQTPRFAKKFSGTGDAFSALMLGHYLSSPSLETAFERAASAIFSVAEMTEESGDDELALVAAQDLLAASARRFFGETALVSDDKSDDTSFAARNC